MLYSHNIDKILVLGIHINLEMYRIQMRMLGTADGRC